MVQVVKGFNEDIGKIFWDAFTNARFKFGTLCATLSAAATTTDYRAQETSALGPLAMSKKNKKYILNILDAFTKYLELITLPSTDGFANMGSP